ncbi:MAG TPA: response regulator [Candidatus Acidoferrales bacterium]|nr:response regulator [Candidatus Acidoferrales bacterium]
MNLRRSETKPRRGLPLRAYVAVLLLTVILVAAATAFAVSYQVRQLSRQTAESEMNSAAQRAAKQLGDGVDILRAAMAADPNPGLAFADPSTCKHRYAPVGAFGTGHIDVVRLDGSIVCSSRAAAAGDPRTPYAGQKWLDSSGPVTLAPILDAVTGRQVALIASPIAGQGVIAAFLDLEPVGPNLASDFGSGAYRVEFLVVTSDGRSILTRSLKSARWTGAPLTGTPFARSADAAERSDVDGKLRLYGQSPVKSTGWKVYSGAELDGVLAAANQLVGQMQQMIAVGLVVLLVATIAAYRGITYPIYRLSGAVRAATGRAEPTPVKARGPAEVVSLTDDFNALLASVHRELSQREKAEREVRALNEELESRVRERTAELERANQELEQANQAVELASRHKSDFLANMSHELRTPLNAILGFSELLIDESSTERDEARHHEYLEQIHGSGEHLLSLINDILDLAKVEAGQMELRPAQFDAGLLLREAIASVEPMAEARRITVTLEGESVRPVRADPGKLKQVVLNLLSNAIKFTPEGGRVTARLRWVGEAVEICVEDSGIGIAPDDIPRLFVEFQQLESGADRRHQGTGLGLALSKRLVELHQGRIWVESEPGKGSRFFLELPQPAPSALPVGAAEVDGQPEEVGDGSRSLVLVVEDNPATARLFAAYLRQGGYRTAIARTGEEALEKAGRLQPVAITLDVLLPGMDGYEVMRQLKAEPRTRQIPVAIVSVVDNPTLGLAMGADDYMVKPVSRQSLLGAVGRLPPGKPRDGAPPTALVIDDDRVVRDVVSASLESAGLHVLRAATGEEGLSLARSLPPALIILDLMLPGISGFDVIKALKEEERTRAIPIVVLTARQLTERERDRLKGQIDSVVEKDSVPGVKLLDWLRGLARWLEPAEGVGAHRS